AAIWRAGEERDMADPGGFRSRALRWACAVLATGLVIALVIFAVRFYLDESCFQQAEKQPFETKLPALEAYLARFPGGEHAEHVRDEIADLEDGRAFEEAMSAKGSALLSKYLETSGGHDAGRTQAARRELEGRVRSEQEEIDFRRARALDTPEGYEAFCAKHADSAHASEASDLRQRALDRQEDAEFGAALADGKPEKFASFLAKRGSLADLGIESTQERASRELDAMSGRPHYRLSPEADASVRYLADRRDGAHRAQAQEILIRALLASKDPFGPILRRAKAAGDDTVTVKISLADPLDQPYKDGALEFLTGGFGRIGFHVRIVTGTAEAADLRFDVEQSSPSGHFDGGGDADPDVRPEEVVMRWTAGTTKEEHTVKTPTQISSSVKITQAIVKKETAAEIGVYFYFPW
ncbi:MAG: hypothetical protein ACRELB_26700, partial [Polyangiaceae bacterium]